MNRDQRFGLGVLLEVIAYGVFYPYLDSVLLFVALMVFMTVGVWFLVNGKKEE